MAKDLSNILKVPVLGYSQYAWFSDKIPLSLPHNQDAIENKDTGAYTPTGPISKPKWYYPESYKK